VAPLGNKTSKYWEFRPQHLLVEILASNLGYHYTVSLPVLLDMRFGESSIGLLPNLGNDLSALLAIYCKSFNEDIWNRAPIIGQPELSSGLMIVCDSKLPSGTEG